MRAVIQRVSYGSVTVENKKIGEVTSVCSTDGELIGLGYIKTGRKPVKSNNIEKSLHTEVILRHTPFTD